MNLYNESIDLFFDGKKTTHYKSLDDENKFFLKLKRVENGINVYLKDIEKNELYLISCYDLLPERKPKILKWLECDSIFKLYREYHKFLDLEDKAFAKFIGLEN